MAEEQQELEVAVGDKKLKFRGSDWLALLGTAVGVLLLYMVWDHKAEAADAARSTAQVLREAGKENAQAIRDSNAAAVKAMEQVATEQRRGNEVMREMTCLLALPQDQRTNRAELCRRIARDPRDDRR
jgi:hypothetical protein